MLLVGGIRVVVLADEAIAGVPSGVGVDTERGDLEVIADRRPLRIGVSDVGGWDIGQRGVRSGDGGDSSGQTAPAVPRLGRLIDKGGAFRGPQPIRSASSTMIPSGPRT